MTFGTYVAKFPQPCLLRFPAARVVSNGIFSWWMMIIPKIKSETWINHQPKGVSWTLIDGRKFESQTSDIWTDAATVVGSVREEKVPRKKIEGNLEVKLPTAWTHGKAEVGRVREEKESEEKESVIRKKIKAHERVETSRSRSTVLFQCFEAPEGRKVGSLKHRVQSHLGEWETIDCARMRREAHFEVKKKIIVGALLEVESLKKVHAFGSTLGSWAFQKNNAWQAQWIQHLAKNEPHVWVLKQFHLQSCVSRGPFEGVGLLKRICKDACRVYRHNTRDISIRHVRRSGSRFPETVSFLEHQIVSFAKMTLRYRCSTSYDLVSLFRGRPVL